MATVTSADLVHEGREAIACTAATVFQLACLAHDKQDRDANEAFIRTLRNLQGVLRMSMSDEADELIAAHIRVIQGWIHDRITDVPSVGEEANQYLRAG